MRSDCIKRLGKFINRKETKLFITFLIIYIYFIQWYGWNEESNFALTKSIVEENRFEIDSFYNLTGDRSVYQEHYYSDKDPGLSFLASPTYMIWKLVYNFFPTKFKIDHAGSTGYVTELHGNVPIVTFIDRGFFIFTSMILVTISTSVLFSSLTAVLVYKISKYFLKNQAYRILLSLTYGIATLAFPSALHFMTNATATFFVFLSFYLLFKIKNEKLKESKYILLAGLAAGFGIATDRFGILLAPLLIIYSFWLNKRLSLVFLSGLFLSILPFLLYNYTIFGNPFDLASSYIDRQIYRTAYPQSTLPIFFSNEKPENFAMMSLLNTDVIKQLFEHFHFIPTLPNPYVIMRLLLYPYRGLLFYSPVLFLSLVGIIFMFKKYRVETTFIILALILFLCVISMRRTWWGGYDFGNRYLLPIVPFLMLPLAFVFDKINKKIIIFLLLISIFFNFLGLQPAEDLAYDWKAMDIRSDWLVKQNSFEILANPLFEHYLPLTLQYGPRSAIFEHLTNGYISIDIRFPSLSKGIDFPFSKFYVPFLVLLPVLLIEIAIWHEEIIDVIKDAIK